jgi:hypothetical protein
MSAVWDFFVGLFNQGIAHPPQNDGEKDFGEQSKLIKDFSPQWKPKEYEITAVPNDPLEFQLSSLSAAYGGLERCKVDAAVFSFVNNHSAGFQRIAQANFPTVCTFGEIDMDGIFYPLGCATFLSSRILLTAWHVACAVSDTSRICVLIESNFSISGYTATCRQRLVRIDVVKARSLVDRDIGILILDDSTVKAMDKIRVETTGLNFSKLTLDKLTGFIMVLHTDNAAKHTVVNISEIPASRIGEQIATYMISDGTFGTCGAAVFNRNGSIAGVYIGADANASYTKGVMSINDIITNEFADFGDSILALFLNESDRISRFMKYHDWIDPAARKASYLPEGAEFEKLRLTKNHDQCILACLGKGGKHCDVQKYNKAYYIESDHFPPFQAYEMTAAWSPHYRRSGKSRVNEFELPAVSLPYTFHRKFITTGSSTVTKNFARRQATMMESPATFKEAIRLNIEEYEKAGLFKPATFIALYNLPRIQACALVLQFKVGIKDALNQHKALKFITDLERQELNVYTQLRK